MCNKQSGHHSLNKQIQESAQKVCSKGEKVVCAHAHTYTHAHTHNQNHVCTNKILRKSLPKDMTRKETTPKGKSQSFAHFTLIVDVLRSWQDEGIIHISILSLTSATRSSFLSTQQSLYFPLWHSLTESSSKTVCFWDGFAHRMLQQQQLMQPQNR